MRRKLTSLDKIDRNLADIASSRNLIGAGSDDLASNGQKVSGHHSIVSRTRTSTGRLRLILSNPVQESREPFIKIALAPEKLVSLRPIKAKGTSDSGDSTEDAENAEEKLQEETGK